MLFFGVIESFWTMNSVSFCTIIPVPQTGFFLHLTSLAMLSASYFNANNNMSKTGLVRMMNFLIPAWRPVQQKTFELFFVQIGSLESGCQILKFWVTNFEVCSSLFTFIVMYLIIKSASREPHPNRNTLS